MSMTLSEELQWRGFIHQTTYKDIAVVDGPPITFYWGVDPSAPSMTIGNLAIAMMVRHFIDHGHNAVLLVGGATGLIGDPDGKAEERNLKTKEEITTNKDEIVKQYARIFDGQDFKLVDNYEWFKDLNYLDFLRDVGKHMPMRQMLGREFVQSRLGEDGSGISYAEFSYALIQGYDYVHLHRTLGVTLQVCGSDQWGNSIAGVELIRRMNGGEANVWSAPLVINKSTGKKFGKTEGGAIWLDEGLTSAYRFYQFWLNVDDEGIEDYLKIYTLLGKEQIENVLREFNENRATRIAQKTLAYEVTKVVHGAGKADDVKRLTNVLFGQGDIRQLSQADFTLLKDELPVLEFSEGEELSQAVTDTGLAQSKSEARRFLEQGAVYINGETAQPNKMLSSPMTLDGTHVLLRRGKNMYAVLVLRASA